ncbi:transcriptional repressor LexA [Candidatus Parcubacteria bacterium]|nr:transcriptional repressor LexA [Candidatus Parcubacteria bacterium]
MIERYKNKIRKFYDDNKIMPSYREMMKMFDLKSKNAVFKLVNKLVDEGSVEKDSQGRLMPTDKLLGGLKVLGSVEAGFPTPAEEDLAETMSLDNYLIQNKEATFMLKVSGESMLDAGIQPGDMLIVERRSDAKDGDIVVAFIDSGYTVKFLRKRREKVWLEAANERFKDIVPAESEELKIMAVVKAVIRKY